VREGAAQACPAAIGEATHDAAAVAETAERTAPIERERPRPPAPAVARVSTKGTGRTRTGSKPAVASGPAKDVDPDDIPL
jgi:hypothetical protein